MIHALFSDKENVCLVPQQLPKRGKIYQTKLTAAVYRGQRTICNANPNPNPRKPRLIRKKKTKNCDLSCKKTIFEAGSG